MMKFGVGFAVDELFITHLHADHYLGVTGLLRTFSLQNREEPLVLWGPKRSHDLLHRIVTLGGEHLSFPVQIRELPAGEAIHYDGFRIDAFDTEHTRESIGLVLIEEDRLGRFDVERARELGVPEGPSFGALHRGEPIELADGGTVNPGDVVGPARPGRRLVYTGDTRPSPNTVAVSTGADVLIHEATFSEEDRARAADTGHSTAREAAEIAAAAGVRRLVLTHLSARLAEQPHLLREEAAAVFPEVIVAKDGFRCEVRFPDDDADRRDDGESRDDLEEA